MGFVLDINARRRRATTAWKVVWGDLSSPFYFYCKGGREWQPNATITCSDGRHEESIGHGHLFVAKHGIYVFTTVTAAREYAGYWFSRPLILKVRVNPKDWLHTSRAGTEATYRKVFVPEKQPYIEWCD